MSEYLVLARKYRSATFDEVVGQEPIAQTLKSAIATGRIAHAYLFTGTRGVGKTTMARILAKALNCLASDKPTISPCNKCESCEAISRGDDMDVVEMDGASNRGIDEIRNLRANAIFRPARARYKIYYIDEVHQVTKDAFNALLKTLEEPPEHVKFIFATTESEKVPATILSRCQRFDFRNIPTRDIAAHLRKLCKKENVQADDDALFRIARAAAGSMRDALSLLDQLLAASAGNVTDAEVVRVLGTPGDERMLAIAGAIASGDVAGALGQLDAILEAGVTLPSAVASLGETFRNMMIAAVCGPASELIELPELQRQALGELARKFTLPVLVQAVGILQTLARNLRTSSVGRALAEAALVRLAAADKFVDPQNLLARLESLAAGAPLKKNLMPDATARDSGLGARDSGLGTRDSRSASASPPVATGGAPVAPQSSAPAIQWDLAWLQSNWRKVVDALTASRQFAVAGLLQPTKPAALAGGVLKLAFEPSHETLRLKCAGDMKDAVEVALSSLAGCAVRCECVSTAPHEAFENGSGNGPAKPRPAFGDLSSTEKTEIMKDPAIRAVLDLFGGDVVDIRRNPAAPAARPATGEGQDDGSPEQA